MNDMTNTTASTDPRPTLTVDTRALTQITLGDGGLLSANIVDPVNGLGLLFLTLPEALRQLLTNYNIDPSSIIPLIPADAPSVLLRFTDIESIGKLVDTLERLMCEATGLTEEQIDTFFDLKQEMLDRIENERAETLHTMATADLFDAETSFGKMMDAIIEEAKAMEVASQAPAEKLMAETIDMAPSLDKPLTREQASNLVELAKGLALFQPERFDQTRGYASVKFDDDKTFTPTPADVYTLAGRPDLFVYYDPFGFAALAIQPDGAETWHDYTLRVFGLTDHDNADVWSFVCGAVIAATNGNTSIDAARRITAVMMKALAEGKVLAD